MTTIIVLVVIVAVITAAARWSQAIGASDKSVHRQLLTQLVQGLLSEIA